MAWDLTQYNANVTAGLIPAGSHLFADDAAFQTLDSAGNIVPNVTGAVYSIPAVPGYATPIPDGDPRLSPLTVYVDVDKPSPGQSVQIKTDGNGYLVPFATPPGHAKVWVDFGAGRVMLTASDLGDQIDSVTQPGASYQLVSQKNQANGYAGLDGNSKLSSSQIPDLSGTYQSKTAANPWRYTMTVNDFGLVLKGVTGSSAQIFQVQDPNGSPIFSVGHVGGAAVYGDALKTFPPGDVFNPAAVIGDDGRISVAGANAGLNVSGSLLLSADIDAVHALGSRGAANGYATLDANGQVPRAQLQGSAYRGDLLRAALTPSGRVETRSRLDSGAVGTLASGTLYLVPIYLPQGTVVNSITFVSSAAASAPTNQWFGLYDLNRVQLATTTNDTTVAWNAGAAKTLNIAQKSSGAATSFTTTYSGLHYLGIMVTATTTMPSLVGGQSIPNVLATASPGFGATNTALTTPPAFPFTAAAVGGAGPSAYAYTA